jgi:hypothetical protein
MPLIYRHEKNSPLTIEELDGNFHALDQRLQEIEEKVERMTFLQEIKIHQNVLHFINTEGKILAEVPFPSLQLNPRGVWEKLTSYKKLDIVALPGQSFICLEDHHSGHHFDTDLSQKKWQIFIDVLTFLKGK